MRTPLRSALLIAVLSPALGCAGAPAPRPETPAAGAVEQGGDQQDERPGEAVGGNAEPGDAESAPEPPQPASVPTSEGDCMEFHLKLIECSARGGDSGPTARAKLRASAESGCRTAVADGDNPVTAHVRQLWARCKDLPCTEAERCFESGMMELSAPPGPYVPSR